MDYQHVSAGKLKQVVVDSIICKYTKVEIFFLNPTKQIVHSCLTDMELKSNICVERGGTISRKSSSPTHLARNTLFDEVTSAHLDFEIE